MNIHCEPDNLHKLITETADILNLDSFAVIEKDFYVTQAIHALSDIQNEYFNLVFQGGTALAKAHKIIDRMSEDCDFRIHASEAWQQKNSSQQRNILRDFRYDAMSCLKNISLH
ncbi:MAG: nucleotidyl transferase AbiEii/AbiGii toxin family protein [Gammaproteobacteria bacterium]